MRLPRKDELVSKDHLLMFDYDLAEWHSNRDTGISVGYKIRLHRLLDIIIKYAKGKSILDIGCAQGNLALLLAERGFKVVATDINFNFLTYSRLKYESGDISYLVSDAQNLPLRSGFDVIVATEILEHMAYPEKFISAIKSLLKPQGVIIISTPNGDYIFSRIYHYSQVKEHLEELTKRQCGPGVESHLFHFTSGELTGIFKKNGFNILNFEFLNTMLLNRKIFFLLQMMIGPALIKRIESFILRIKGLNKFLAYSSLLVADLQ